jgi:hypothetical protein
VCEIKKKLNKLELDRFFKTIARQLEVVFGGKFTQRVTENILCKAHRVLSNKAEEKWCDIVSASQFLCKFAPVGRSLSHTQLARKKLLTVTQQSVGFHVAIDGSRWRKWSRNLDSRKSCHHKVECLDSNSSTLFGFLRSSLKLNTN